MPSVLCIIQNYRVSNPISGWSALLYDRNQRYIHILQCLFFPPDLPARPNFTPDSESKWASLGAWLPMFSMAGVIGWMQLKRRHWLKKMLCVLLFMAFIPGLNALFQLMNASYYARWFYMLTLMMAAATMMALENPRVDWRRSLKWTTLITLAMTLVIGLMPTLTKTDGEITDVTFGLENTPRASGHTPPLRSSHLHLSALFLHFITAAPARSTALRPSVSASPSCCILFSSSRSAKHSRITPMITSSPTP